MLLGQAKILKLILRSLFAKSSCAMYPFKKPETFPSTRGSIAMEHPDKCILCSICARKCPPEAIAVSKEGGTWTIDRLRCIACGACVEACPKKCLSMSADRPGPSLCESAPETVSIRKPSAQDAGAPSLKP